MRFMVERTSVYDDETPPCDGAERVEVPYWDTRTSATPEAFDATVGKRYGEKWHDEGADHKVIPGRGITRRKGTRVAWAIEIADLDELLAFEREHGELVLSSHGFGIDPEAGEPTIEIYDDYRE